MSDDAFRFPAASDFDHRSPDVVVPQQLAIRVFVNSSGEIMLVQCADWCDEENSRIVIAPVHARSVANAILRCAAEASGDDVSVTPVTGNRNAARQRRYRERQRNGTDETRGDGAGRNAANVTLVPASGPDGR